VVDVAAAWGRWSDGEPTRSSGRDHATGSDPLKSKKTTPRTKTKEQERSCARPAPLIAIVNYEKFNPDDVGKDECRHLAGVVLDESSRLAMGGGKQKWAIIHSTKGIAYKLSCTATPAPNDTMEFASQASFLERMRSEGEIIWTYFTRTPRRTAGRSRNTPGPAFFEFMSSWSIYVRDPRRYGWRRGMKDLPPPRSSATSCSRRPSNSLPRRS
jgi:hypothetical protein